MHGLEIHYATSSEEREREYLVAAPRGGFEPGAFEVAHLIASCGPYLYYLCKPEERKEDERRSRPPVPPLIASAQITRPDLARLAARVGRLVVVRGYLRSADEPFVLVGGGDEHLKDVTGEELTKAGFAVNPRNVTQPMGAKNICNRGKKRRGMQITLSRPLGADLLKDSGRAGVLVSAIVEALNLCRFAA